MDNYIEAKFKIKEAEQDTLIAELESAGFDTFWQEPDCLMAYIPEKDFDSTFFAAYCSERSLEASLAPIPPQNWNAVWEASYEPIVVNDFCRIRASFHPLEESFAYQLTIDPKTSFGTGHHETTRLMIRQMETLSFVEKNALDMGAGTGVLGILALKMGAATVTFVDIEPDSVENTKENIVLNEVVAGAEAFVGSAEVLKHKTFDCILANINRNVLLNDGAAYVAALRPGGRLLLSGFFDFDSPKIIAYFTALNLTVGQILSENGWESVCFIKG